MYIKGWFETSLVATSLTNVGFIFRSDKIRKNKRTQLLQKSKKRKNGTFSKFFDTLSQIIGLEYRSNLTGKQLLVNK